MATSYAIAHCPLPPSYSRAMTTPAVVTPHLLEAEDLYLHYLGGPERTVHAVDGISFALRERGTALGVW